MIDVSESKSEGTKSFNEDTLQSKKLVIHEFKLTTTLEPDDGSFVEATEKCYVYILLSKGFQVCQ